VRVVNRPSPRLGSHPHRARDVGWPPPHHVKALLQAWVYGSVWRKVGVAFWSRVLRDEEDAGEEPGSEALEGDGNDNGMGGSAGGAPSWQA
jgi:hypothetical protein